jgi:hypothetical protein
MSLTTSLNFRLTAALVAAIDLVTKSAPLDFTFSDDLASGTGVDAADVIFSDTRSTATNEDLDLAGGGLTDNLGAAFAPAKLKLLFVSAPGTNPGNIVVKRPASNGVPIFDSAGDSHTILPGGCLLLYTPAAAGICSVTAGTGDLINVASSSGTSFYTIIIIGTSA